MVAPAPPIDLLVIGAGLHGLVVAKTYAESLPRATILLVDSAGSIGGVWARERLYPGLKTNNAVGSYEFSDFPMILQRYGLRPGQHIPGHIVHQYLVDFAHHFDLVRRVKLNTKVKAATLGDDGIWRVELGQSGGENGGDGEPQALMAHNIAVATGLTSEPHIPIYPGLQDKFRGRFLHSIDLNSRAHYLHNVKGNVLVVGGNKSAWDVCYMAATASPEATIHMLIRPSGRGPSWMWRRRGLLNFLSISRITSTRIFTWLDPNPLASSTQHIFMASWLGRLLCAIFWTFLDYLVLWTSGYLPTKSGNGLEPLRPRLSTFWMGNSLSVHNYETDWFDLVKQGRIIVHHAEIDAFTASHAVRLSNGQQIGQVSAAVACTGWKYTPSIRFSPDPALLGVPADSGRMEKKAAQTASDRLQFPEYYCINSATRPSNDAHILSKDPTGVPPRLQLYRFMAPLDLHLASPRIRQHSNANNKNSSLLFIGFYQSVQTTLVAQAQALWATAYFQRAMTSPAAPGNLQSRREWTRKNTTYQQCRRRGSPFPDLVLDALPYVDLLLGDVGVRRLRKRGGACGGWWRNLTAQHGPGDYRGLVQEWQRLAVRDVACNQVGECGEEGEEREKGERG
ncbi:FAD/NAD(P)-binding domain-containing protein [Coniochaeta ligniaria NRRL 30616]|uniref:FAD/NAD(P)-binding domain-containing protein n=1 Tax=Coniochaeta ligniaria NRRL 30616 TaxID=1408157 RepID=A0A1J7JHJ0_9PEZI|nr:FAD/NAD(P)-binding domain-containing protein [Coniochaeta ligniaria NRRL 30616]